MERRTYSRPITKVMKIAVKGNILSDAIAGSDFAPDIETLYGPLEPEDLESPLF